MHKRFTSITSSSKKVFTVGKYKGEIQPSHPAKFYGWVYVTELEMIASAYGDSEQAVAEAVSAKISEMKIIVPVRTALFERIETAIEKLFPTKLEGYNFLNAQQKEWRAAASERLEELASMLEGLAANANAAENSKMICLSARKDEFREALKRADNFDLEVFPGWERDSFHVKNHSEGTEYFVTLKSESGRVWADCECRDFIFRKRICKHISAVLTDTVFGHLARK